MRVLAVAQQLLAPPGDGERLREVLAALPGHPRGDRGIVGGGTRIGRAGETAAQREARRAVMRRELGEEFLVVAGIGQDRHEIMVLRRRADQGGTADIDFSMQSSNAAPRATVAAKG